MININMKKTSIVKPAEKTPQRTMPLTLLDRLRPFPQYNSVIYVYRQSIVCVDSATLRESLSKTLVYFYPVAGRYVRDSHGIIGIDCNDAGVLFVEVEIDSVLEDLGDLAPTSDMSVLVPSIDFNAQDISSNPIMAVQVNYFKCGAVALGIRMEHHTADGSSAFHLTKSWSEIARGIEISTLPFLDRTSVIRPHDPPRPIFNHTEFSINSSAKRVSRSPNTNVKVSVFKLTKDQLNKAKAKANRTNADSAYRTNYSTFEALVGHIWKCVCKASKVGSEEEARLKFPVNARFNRWKPNLPPGFLGNAIFRAFPVAGTGDLVSKPLSFAASKVHEASVRMDSEYMRSTIDYVALLPDQSIGPHLFKGSAFQITSWARMGLNEADFGWGPPIYSGPGNIMFEKAYIFPSDDNEGLSVAIALQAEHMEIFEKLFYQF